MPEARNRRGATLIDTVMAVILLGVAIPPLTQLFTEVAAHDADHTYQGAALGFAEAMLEEIVSKAFEDPDLPTRSFGTEEGARIDFDDIDDFDGLSNTPPTAFDGALLDDYGGFTRSVTVDNVTSGDPDPLTPAGDGTTDLKRIRVTVAWTGGKGGELTLSTLRALLILPDISSPLDEAASAASAAVLDSTTLTLDLVSDFSTYALLESFELSSVGASSAVKYLDLATKPIWIGSGSGVSLPTGVVPLNKGTPIQRAILQGSSPTLECGFAQAQSGSVTYTLVLHFTNGSSSTITFPIGW
ncbi:MAG: hypothetical protein H8E31_02840 [Planctomycetes bacterium]|nr:hypothetical protein [Planctomycetota bacterium]